MKKKNNKIFESPYFVLSAERHGRDFYMKTHVGAMCLVSVHQYSLLSIRLRI